ncbi:MAG: hypothetical protein KW788_04945 [Candidatus Doudnabacteria bacterium]|nr:hypothetical protein [Candidatus Doudnabacteria bacterium]
MVTPDLIEYVKSSMASGTDAEAIKNELRSQGWANDDIDSALVSAGSGVPSPAHASIEAAGSGWHVTKKEIFIVVAGLLLLSGAGAAAFYLIPPAPEKVLQTSAENFASANSFDYSGNMVVDISAPSGLFSMNTLLHGLPKGLDSRIAGASDTKFNLDFSGTADVTDANHPKSNLDLNFSYSLFQFGMNLRLLDKIVYLKFNSLPNVPEYNIAKYSGVWIKIDPADVSEQYGLDMNTSSKQPDLTPGQKQQIKDLAANAHFFNSITKLADDTIDGDAMYHYSVDVDMQGLKDYFHEVERIENSTATTDTDLDTMSFRNSEVWIGKSDRMLHKLLTQVSAAPTPGTTTQASGSVNILLNLKNYNQPSSIMPPADYKNFVEVIKELSQPITTAPTK